MIRVALYGRVSTSKQDNENQLTQLRSFAATQGWEIVSEYRDEVSGGRSDRPAFKAMLEAASQHRFDVLLFWALDRLSREGVLETLQYLELLTRCGVAWRSYTEQYLDSTGIFRDAVIGILAAIAKQERVRRSERTKAGLQRARARGKQLGRPRIAIDEEQVRLLRSEGLSWPAIAAKIGGISRETARRIGHPAAHP